jgi:16S rRNA (uracil1498-N3)-methyltransferase
MHRSYVSKTWIDAFINSEQEVLPKESEARFFSVLRIKPDEEVAVFDGHGREVVGRLQRRAAGAHFVGARLCTRAKQLPEIVVIQSAIDEAKLAQTIQRGCEFGVDRFIIFPARRSEAHCFARLAKRLDRLMRIAEDASRQCGRYYLPSIELCELDAILKAMRTGLGIFGDVNSETHLSQLLRQQAASEQPCVIAIGPEGGLHPDEMVKLTAAGFHGVRWAPHVLRAELAMLAPVAILNAFYGRA